LKSSSNRCWTGLLPQSDEPFPLHNLHAEAICHLCPTDYTAASIVAPATAASFMG
jgi:hypothetical protein